MIAINGADVMRATSRAFELCTFPDADGLFHNDMVTEYVPGLTLSCDVPHSGYSTRPGVLR